MYIYLIISIWVILLGAVTAVHAFAERKRFSAVLGVACISSVVSQVTYIASLHVDNYKAVSIWSSIYFLTKALTIAIIFTFVRGHVVKNQSDKSKKLWKGVFFAFFALDILCFAINPIKEIMVHYVHCVGPLTHYAHSYKPLFWGHFAFLGFLAISIFIYLVKRASSIPHEYRKQYLGAVYHLSFVFVLDAILLVFPDIFGEYWVDYSTWGYSFVLFSLYLNFYRYPITGMKSFYHEWIVENINQGVVLFNFEGELIIHNDKFHSIFPDCDIYSLMPISQFVEKLNLDIKEGRNDEDYSFQYYIKKDDKELPVRFDHRCLRNEAGKSIGELFVFTDETTEVDLLTSFYSWEKFKQVIIDEPENFDPPFVVAVCDINGLGDINNRFGKNAGDQAIEYLASIIRKHFTGESYYVRGQEAALIILSFDLDEKQVREKLKEIHSELVGVTEMGFIVNIQSAVGIVNYSNPDVLMVVKDTLKGMKNKKLLDVKSKSSELVTSLIRTLAECDNDTEEHVKRTQFMGERLGKRLGLSDRQLSDLALLCIMHDIGKISIPLEILNKPGKLSDAEWRMMRTHTEKGYQIAMSSKELEHIAEMVLHHHECWDGRGYPDGLSKESIPLLSRIISVVDAYDAMTNDRVYRPAMTTEAAIKELKKCAGTQFDPGIVNEFVSMLSNVDINESSEELSDILSAATKPQAVVDNQNSAPTVAVKTNVHSVPYCRYVLDEKMRIIEIDEQFERITGYSLDDIKNNEITQADLLPEDDRTDYLRVVGEQLSRKNLAYFEHRILRKDGTIIFVFCYGKVYFDSAEKAQRSEIIVFDSANTYAMKLMIDEEKTKADVRLSKWENKYRCDSLTGLLNHEAFKNDVEMKLLDKNVKVMLLMMDVDKFKQYNDTYGHRAGDEFLIMLAQSLTGTLRKDDLACRMGGDEFAAALFYSNQVSDQTMLERAQQICDKINMVLTSWQGGTSLSMGVVISDEEKNTFNKLYESSDKALYEAKEGGRSRMVISK